MKNKDIFCPNCKEKISEKIIKKISTGEYETCPKCDFILKGEQLGINIKKTDYSSVITELADSSVKKKKRKLKAYYCPHCNQPNTRLNENQLNLLEMGMVVECKECGAIIKKEDLDL